MDEMRQWLVFLRERQPHLDIRLRHISNMMDGPYTARNRAAMKLSVLTVDYPEDYLVFKSKQRLLGK